MRLALAAVALALPLAATAQSTIPVEDAPFAAAGAQAPRLESAQALGGTYTPVPIEQVNTQLVSQAEVLDVSGNRIGNANGVLFDRGAPVALVFRVGGIFGVFEKPVTVPLMRTTVARSDSGATRIILDITEKDLRGMDRYEGPALTQ